MSVENRILFFSRAKQTVAYPFDVVVFGKIVGFGGVGIDDVAWLGCWDYEPDYFHEKKFWDEQQNEKNATFVEKFTKVYSKLPNKSIIDVSVLQATNNLTFLLEIDEQFMRHLCGIFPVEKEANSVRLKLTGSLAILRELDYDYFEKKEEGEDLSSLVLFESDFNFVIDMHEVWETIKTIEKVTLNFLNHYVESTLTSTRLDEESLETQPHWISELDFVVEWKDDEGDSASD